MKYLLITFDIEEFVYPKESGLDYSNSRCFEIGKKGLESIMNILNEYGMSSTFFVTVDFAKKYPELIKKLSESGNEIAFHGNSHSDRYDQMSSIKCRMLLKKGKSSLEKITGRKVYGFRAPRFKKPEESIIKNAGFLYDSSYHPAIFFGNYNCTRINKAILMDGLFSVPVSVLPIIRLPFSWIWFRNIGWYYSFMCTKACLASSDYAMLYFHSWDFADIQKEKHNGLFWQVYKNNSGKKITKSFKKYLDMLIDEKIKKTTIREYIDAKKNGENKV